MYESMTEGQLIDELNRITEKRSPTVADRDRATAVLAALDERQGVSRSDYREPADDGISRGYSGRNAAKSPEDRAFTDYLRNGTMAPELRAAAQGEGTGAAGGYTVPQSFWDRLAIALKAYGGLSSDFMQVPTDDGRIMPWATNNPTTTLASYITENSQISNTNYVFGQGMMFAWCLAELVLCSVQLIQDSSQDVDAFVADRIGEAVGRKVAAECVTGLGAASKALTGIIPSLSAFGQNVDSGGWIQLGAATAINIDGAATTELAANTPSVATLRAMVGAVDRAYWPGCKWYLSTAQLNGIRGLTDSNKRYLLDLDTSVLQGEPQNLLGFPIQVVPEVPALAASTVGGPLFGNMSHAMALRTVKDVSIMRLTERYADFLQVGYLGYVRMDSQPNDLRAACTVKASST